MAETPKLPTDAEIEAAIADGITKEDISNLANTLGVEPFVKDMLGSLLLVDPAQKFTTLRPNPARTDGVVFDFHPPTDNSLSALLRFREEDPERFRAAWAIMTRGDISLAGSANYVTAYDDWVSGNADPGIFAEKYGFDIGTVYSGDLRDDEGLAGISTPDIQRRGELARTYMDDHDARRVGHDLGREIGDIVTEVEEEPEEIVGFSSMTDLEKRGILTGTEIRNIQATIRGDLDFDTSKVVTDPNFGGLLDRTFNSEFPESGVLGSRGSYVGDRFHVTWDTDLFGIGNLL